MTDFEKIVVRLLLLMVKIKVCHLCITLTDTKGDKNVQETLLEVGKDLQELEEDFGDLVM